MILVLQATQLSLYNQYDYLQQTRIKKYVLKTCRNKYFLIIGPHTLKHLWNLIFNFHIEITFEERYGVRSPKRGDMGNGSTSWFLEINADGAGAASSFVVFIALINSSGSVKTLSLDDFWLDGIEISATTVHLLANNHESVTRSVGSCFCIWFVAGINNVPDDSSLTFVSFDSINSIDFRDLSSFSFSCFSWLCDFFSDDSDITGPIYLKKRTEIYNTNFF